MSNGNSETVSLDRCMAQLLVWDLKFEFGGQAFATRPALVADLAQIEAVMAGEQQSVERIAELTASLFAEPRPDVRAWPIELHLVVLARVSGYVSEQAKKNAPTLLAKNRGDGAGMPPDTAPSRTSPTTPENTAKTSGS
jgi:hypothetical protein